MSSSPSLSPRTRFGGGWPHSGGRTVRTHGPILVVSDGRFRENKKNKHLERWRTIGAEIGGAR